MQPTSIHVSAVQVPADRQRREFDPVAILELANSIDENGLIHAIALRWDEQTLVAGERRKRAIEEHFIPMGKQVRYAGELLPVGHLPYVKVSSNDLIELEAIELAENLDRRDLTWQERADATARLHALKQKQAVKSVVEFDPAAEHQLQKMPSLVDTLHSVADTTRLLHPELKDKELGGYATNVRKEIIVARHLDKPEVRAAATLNDAFKVIKRIEDSERTKTLAALVGETFSAKDHHIIHGNCLEVMRRWELAGEVKFDVICTDPLYGMGAHEFGDAGGKMVGIDHQYDDSYENWQAIMPEWAILAYAVAAPQAHAYVWCDFDRFHELKSYMQKAGWYVHRTPILSYKINSGRVPLPDKGPRRQYETCLYAIKGDKLTTGIYSDVIPCEADEQMGHGAQKPIALFENLLKRSVKPGDKVLDAFAGTGTTLEAAHNLKCTSWCIELDQASYGKILERVQRLDLQGALL